MLNGCARTTRAGRPITVRPGTGDNRRSQKSSGLFAAFRVELFTVWV
jgi:hypothetical protein